MARMIRDTESSIRHKSAARRLMRNCKRVKNCEKFIPVMTGSYTILIGKMAITEQKAEEREDIQDDLNFTEMELIESVHTASDLCKKEDRDNPGFGAYLKVFSDINLTDFTKLEIDKKPNVAEQFAVRIDTFGKEHPLQQCAVDIRLKNTLMRKASSNSAESVSVQKIAETEEDLAKAQVRKTYEGIFYDTKKEFGDKIAERFSQNSVPVAVQPAKTQQPATLKRKMIQNLKLLLKKVLLKWNNRSFTTKSRAPFTEAWLFFFDK